jgi:dUTP pyrophosphatase
MEENSLNKELDRIYMEMKLTNNVNMDNRQVVKFINESNNPKPEYETEGASGLDLRANLEDGIDIELGPLERRIIPTGVFVELPLGIELQVRSRSGLAAKHGIMVLNSPGTVDADYRGEVGVILINLSNDKFKISHGDRIAQGVLIKSGGPLEYRWEEVSELSSTERGKGGFGSTGIK